MLGDHEFNVLISRLKVSSKSGSAPVRRGIDVDRLILESEELRSLLTRMKRIMKDQRDILNNMHMIGD